MALFEAENIAVAYSGTGIEGINFALEVGCVYDLVGPSGSGKSMLLRACAQMMPVRDGLLRLSGTAASEYTPQQWRCQVALVPQQATMVPGTIRDNLLFPWTLKVNAGKKKPTDAELQRLLDLAALDCKLDHSAAKLSGGQAARVALLRTFATKPKVLLMDEVDAALDDASSQAVSALTLAQVKEGATALRVRHRGSDRLADATFTLGPIGLSRKENSHD